MALPAFTFDTHKFVCKLKGAGFNDQQAEALTDAVQESQASLNVATKQDVVDVRRDMEQGFADVRREIGDLRKDMDAKFAGVDAKFAGVDAKFAGLEQRFDSKLDRAVSGLRQEMSDMKFVLIKWIVGLGLAQTGLWFTLKLFPIGSYFMQRLPTVERRWISFLWPSLEGVIWCCSCLYIFLIPEYQILDGFDDSLFGVIL